MGNQHDGTHRRGVTSYDGAMLTLLLAGACATGPVDSADTGDSDTGDSGNPAPGVVLEPVLTVRGDSSASTGRAMDFGPALDGGARSSVWVSGYFVNRLCRFQGKSGEVSLHDAELCITSSSRDSLGFSVAAGQDLVAAGAIGGATNGAYSGTVYLFDALLRDGASDAAEASARVLGELTNDYAGTTVDWLGAPDGDVLLVGAPGSDANGPGSGRLYAFGAGALLGEVQASDAPTIVQGTTPTAEVRHGDPEAGDGVGQVIGSAGDLDGDGADDLVIGCIGADDGGSNAGLVAAFLSPLPEGVLALRDGDLLITGVEADQYVGDFTVGLGDATGDGLSDLALSGETLDREGRTWVMSSPVRSGTVADAAVNFLGEVELDQAGAHLAAAGDTDGNGLADLMVGAYGQDGAGVDAGAAYLLLAPFAPGSHSLDDAHGRWQGEAEGDYGGRVVVGGGDYDGDGLADLIVGAPYSDRGGAFAGSAYVFAPF
ncbi:MAG: hypothetical protein EXR71_11865 [Myxococcales bacterium]|nr:hypothetical protein [Myxococcales bacterium]